MDHLAWQPRWSKVRASDADRDRVAEQLQEHCVAGRITVDELGERLDHTFAARTLGDLSVVLQDLPPLERQPAAWPGTQSPARRRRVRPVPIFLILLLLWMATRAVVVPGGGIFVVWLVVLVVMLCGRRLMWSAHPHHHNR